MDIRRKYVGIARRVRVEPDFCMVEHGESEKHAEVFLTEHLFFISKINFQNESFLYIQPRFL